jgi:hypothetical protein
MYMELEQSTRAEIDRMRKEQIDSTKDLNQSWQSRYEALEEGQQSYKTAKDNLEHSNEHLRKEVLDLKMRHE